ncbi:MAG: methyltransferase [Dehalococcoidia bacterium]
MSADPDPYFKKRISFEHQGEQLEFDVAHTLFSSHEIDQGTALLLRTLDVEAPARVLDLGCGYGALGITLGRCFPDANVTMIDSDLLAVRYAHHNCALNNITNAQVIAGVGIDDAPPGDFDLIVSNIPAKIGDDAIEQEFVLAPLARLTTGGAFWFVVVSGLNRLIPKIAVRNDLRLREMKKRAGHTVYVLRRTKN